MVNLSKSVEEALSHIPKKGEPITSLELLQSILDSKYDKINASKKILERENINQLVSYSIEDWQEEIKRLFNKNAGKELGGDLTAFGVLLIDQNLGKAYYKDNFLYEFVSPEKVSKISELLTEKSIIENRLKSDIT